MWWPTSTFTSDEIIHNQYIVATSFRSIRLRTTRFTLSWEWQDHRAKVRDWGTTMHEWILDPMA
jgi:hypothetical protein